MKLYLCEKSTRDEDIRDEEIRGRRERLVREPVDLVHPHQIRPAREEDSGEAARSGDEGLRQEERGTPAR